jgi:hypothetical protein
MLTRAAIDLILRFEIGGSMDYYARHLARPSWPGGASGVTIGIGYDLGYEQTFEHDWAGRLGSTEMARLARLHGLTHGRAASSISGVRDIVIPWGDALAVFEAHTLPHYVAETLRAFPRANLLQPDAFGALVSLVFNRGSRVDATDRRREMLEIRNILSCGNDEIVDAEDTRRIAAAVKRMARLWPDNTKSDGDLHDRRLAEAALILSTVS